MIRAGGDLQLLQGYGGMVNDSDNPTQVYWQRAATKKILYSIINSNAMNYEILGYRLPVWVIVVILINVSLFVIFMGWGAAPLRLSYKKLKPAPASITIGDLFCSSLFSFFYDIGGAF